MHLEERADHRFVQDSYGYRPGKSAHQALAACRQRCWKYDWVIDLDVQKFFDEVPWDLVLRAVGAVTDCRWVLLYVERWLAAPFVRPNGAVEERSKDDPVSLSHRPNFLYTLRGDQPAPGGKWLEPPFQGEGHALEQTTLRDIGKRMGTENSKEVRIQPHSG